MRELGICAFPPPAASAPKSRGSDFGFCPEQVADVRGLSEKKGGRWET